MLKEKAVFLESNIAVRMMINPYWLEHLLNLFYQGFMAEVQEEIWDTQYKNSREIEKWAYGIIGRQFDKKHINLKDLKKGQEVSP